jgi:uncharacterized protein
MKLAILSLGLAALLAGCHGPAAPAADNRSAAVAAPAAQGASAFPALTGRVVDGADLLSPAQEASLTQLSAGLESRTSDQLVIVTVPTLGGRDIADYGRDLGNHWGVGQAGRNNGVLLIVAPHERRTRIEVGTGLTAILTNERARQIMDQALVPQFRAGHWFAGIEAGSAAIVAALTPQPREGGGR